MKKFLGKKYSLQRKIIFVYFFFGLLPIVIITFLESIIYYNSMLKEAYNLVEQNAVQHEIVVQERMDAYKNVLYELVTNQEYIQLASAIEEDEDTKLLVDTAHMEALLRSSVYTHDAIRSISFIGTNEKFVSYSKWYGSTNEVIWSDVERRNKIYEEIKDKENLTFIATVNLKKGEKKDDYVVLMGFPVRNLRTKEQSGVLVIALEDDILLFDNKRSRRHNNGVTTVIVDKNNKILAGTDTLIKLANEQYKNYIANKYGNIKQIKENRKKIEGTEWTIINIIDTKVYSQEIFFIVRIVILLIAAITCLFFLILFCASKKYINDVQKIAQGLHDYAGNGTKHIEVDLREEDELYVIVSQFNKMTNRVNALVKALQQKNKEVMEAAISQKHAEIKALEAQINPHFLFNTLDSINWRAIEHDEEEISNMLGALGSLLRYSVSNIDMVVVMEAEVSWLEKYIFLQRDRFNQSFDCEYSITEDAMKFPIYKMLLQPLIENAIIHAFEEIKSGGMIYVTAYVRSDGKLYVSVKDNGAGMSEERLKDIHNQIQEMGALSSKSIGISNVIHRLRIYYGKEAEIQVASELGNGTEIVMIIPEYQEGKHTNEDNFNCRR